jgi:hypothetical protein
LGNSGDTQNGAEQCYCIVGFIHGRELSHSSGAARFSSQPYVGKEAVAKTASLCG